MKRIQTIASVAAVGALLAVPAASQAHHESGHTKGGGTAKSCAKKPTVNKGFVVKGTLVSYDAGSAASGDETVIVTVTRTNRHAARSGLTDADGTLAGTQYKLTGAGAGGDPFKVKLSGYDGAADGPSAGDKVRVVGKVAVTRKRCAPAGTSLEDRYGAVNVRRVKIVDAD